MQTLLEYLESETTARVNSNNPSFIRDSHSDSAQVSNDIRSKFYEDLFIYKLSENIARRESDLSVCKFAEIKHHNIGSQVTMFCNMQPNIKLVT